MIFWKIRYSHSTSLHRGIKMGNSNWCENLTKCWGRGRGRGGGGGGGGGGEESLATN